MSQKRQMRSATLRAQPHRGRKKLFGGLKSAEQVHADVAFPVGARCQSCNGPRPVVRAITMCPLSDAIKQWPELQQLDPPTLFKRIVQIKENPADAMGAPYVRVSMVYSCKACAPALEKSLAKLPSWMIVEINRGPGPDKILVEVN